MERYQAILDFWFGPGSGPQMWFGADPATDRAVRERFAADVDAAVAGRLQAWEAAPESTLALVILLDQFSMQLHRKQRQGYEQSALAIPIAERAIARGFDTRLGRDQRAFLYMPFMHAEDLDLQEKSVRLFAGLAKSFGEKAVEGNLKFATQHRDIVRRYGRFPGRNQAYGRANTPAEQEYLDQGGYF